MTNIAFLTMTIGHIGHIFFPHLIILRVFGRVAYPIFAYGVAKGYKRTRNLSNYALRLWYLALISQIPFYLYLEVRQFNVCFTLLAGLLAIHIINFKIHIAFRLFFIALVIAVAELFGFDSGAYGVLLVIMFYLLEDKPKELFLVMNVLNIAAAFYHHYPIQVFAIFAIPIIFYNDRLKLKFFKNNNSKKYQEAIKWFKYSYYPLHLMVLYLIKIYFY